VPQPWVLETFLILFANSVEHHFICPYCAAEISMLLDPSVEKQAYIEDCEVCCNPIQIRFQWSMQSQTLDYFEATPIGQ